MKSFDLTLRLIQARAVTNYTIHALEISDADQDVKLRQLDEPLKPLYHIMLLWHTIDMASKGMDRFHPIESQFHAQILVTAINKMLNQPFMSTYVHAKEIQEQLAFVKSQLMGTDFRPCENLMLRNPQFAGLRV